MITSAVSHRVGHRRDAQSVGLGLRPALASLVQPDDDVDAGIAQIQGVGMTLAAVADDGHGLALERVESGIALVIDLRGHAASPVDRSSARAAIVPGPTARATVVTRTKSAASRRSRFSSRATSCRSPATASSRSGASAVLHADRAEPRIIATGPVRTSSRMPKAFSMFSRPSIWSSGPVASISNVVGLASTTRAL